MTDRISKKQFIYAAIKALRDRRPDRCGLSHRRLTAVFREYYGEELIHELERLEQYGDIVLVRKRSGEITIYNPVDLPKNFKWPNRGDGKLEKVLAVAETL